MNAPSVDGFANYRKKELTPMRPYVPGEDMTYVSVSPGVTPELGGMIAINPRNPIDAWYVSPEYFAANYILA